MVAPEGRLSPPLEGEQERHTNSNIKSSTHSALTYTSFFFLAAGITASQESITITEREPVLMHEPEVSIVSVAIATRHCERTVE